MQNRLSPLDALKDWEVRNVQRELDSFERSGSGRPRSAALSPSRDLLLVQGWPLPDRFRPADEIDVLLVIDRYPAHPPIGLYVLNQGNHSAVNKLRSSVNAFRDRAFHEAQSISGYTWICYAYANNRWHFNASAPHAGDNIGKFLNRFYEIAR